MPPRRRTPERTLPALSLVGSLDPVPVVLALLSPATPPADGTPDTDGDTDGAPQISSDPAGAAAAVPSLPSAWLEAGVLSDTTLRWLPELLRRSKAGTDAGQLTSLVLPEGGIELLLVVGAGDGSPRAARAAGAAVARATRERPDVGVVLGGLPADAFEEGYLLGGYQIEGKGSAVATRVRLLAETAQAEAAPGAPARRAPVVATAVLRARDLGNTPALVATPGWIADQAERWAGQAGVRVRVRGEKELAEEGFGGILGVSAGSVNPPRLLEMILDGAGPSAPHAVLVGKGVTFDSGGLSLKPADSMMSMKTDMCGGAAVIGAMCALAELGTPWRVTGLVPLVENMPSGSATRPGDVLTIWGGGTVEVLNTDAEGRLILADALAYAAATLRPDALVDLATLTGAMPMALGRSTAGLFASDDALAAALTRAAESAGEPVWRMPLVEDYRWALDSEVADLRNIGGPAVSAGAVTAALFLRHFTGGRPWAHLDIAGTARSDSDRDELTRGATGFGVRLLVDWLARLP